VALRRLVVRDERHLSFRHVAGDRQMSSTEVLNFFACSSSPFLAVSL